MESVSNCRVMENGTRDGDTQPRLVQINILKRKKESSGEKGKSKAMKVSDCDRENVKKGLTKKGCKMLHLGQITEAIRENGRDIEFKRVESDVDGIVENTQGP